MADAGEASATCCASLRMLCLFVGLLRGIVIREIEPACRFADGYLNHTAHIEKHSYRLEGGFGTMHEAAMMQKVVTTILTSAEQAGASRVTQVCLEVGVSGHFTEEAVRQYFLILARGTLLEGATLEVTWLPAVYQCLSCQQCFESASSTARCPYCGDVAWEIAHHDTCFIRSIDLAFSEEP